MTRLTIAAALAFAIMGFSPGPAAAREAPWCAFRDVGFGTFTEDCSYWSLEACVPEVIAGNRGFCNPNPRYKGPPPESRRKHRVRRR